MNDQEIPVSVKSRFTTEVPRIYRIGFYFVHVVLIITASLPTFFFVYHRYQEDHFISGTSKSPDTATQFDAFNIDINDAYSSTNVTKKSLNVSIGVPICRVPLVYSNLTNQCFVPCEWSTMMLTRTHKYYYVLMAVGLWLSLFAAIFILITWFRIQSLRKFPHVVRFYIIICCGLLACCKMIPLRIGLKKVFCKETKRWDPSGMTSLIITIQGASCHYLTLCLSFWATCFIANTYLVVVKGTRKLFESSFLIHLIQSLLCWVGPAIILGICVYVKYPSQAYKLVFIDMMTAEPCGELLNYLAVTLPMEITLGISLCLLWSITWCIRRSRLDNTRHAIRSDKDSQSMLRIERQFTSMKVIILLVVGALLSFTTIKDYQLHALVDKAVKYFECLKSTETECQQPNLLTPLYAVIIVSPGFLCMVLFFLLFMNKDCRRIWVSCFQTLCRLGKPTKPRSGTTKSRCSSVLTVFGERRFSDVTPSKNRARTMRSSSTPNLVGVLDGIPSPLLKTKASLSPLALENRQRSSSTPVVKFLVGDNHDNQSKMAVVSIVNSLPRPMTRLPTPSNFNIEIKIIGEDECVTESQQRCNDYVTENQRNVDSVTDINQSLDCVTPNVQHGPCSEKTKSSCFNSNCDRYEMSSKTKPDCISECKSNQDDSKNSPNHMSSRNDTAICEAGNIIQKPYNYTTKL